MIKRFKVSILDYLGKYEGGVMVLLSIIFESKYYEATYFYTSEHLVFTVPEDLEEALGCKIHEVPEYKELVKYIIGKVIPYSEIYNRLDDIDFNKYNDNQETTQPS